MAKITKTQGTGILAHSLVTHPASVIGDAQAVTTKLSATITLFHASIEATANTNPGRFFVQISPSSSGDEDWATVAEFTATTTAAVTEAFTATEPAAETVLAVASTAGFAALDGLYVVDAGTLADSEWGKCKEIVTNTSIDLVDGLTTGKDSSDAVWNQAEVFVCQLDLTSVGRLRVIFLHEGAAGADCHVKGMMATGDSIG